MGKFAEGEAKLEGEGYPKSYAGAVMYKVGKAKYGKKGMEEKAETGRRKKDRERKEKDS